MSRIGKKPIGLPAGVEAKIEGPGLVVKGPKGELRLRPNPLVKVALQDQQIIVSISEPENRKQKAMWGLTRTLIDNLVQGVTIGFQKQLEINGIGYKASVSPPTGEAGGQKLILHVGFSHPVEFAIPEGIEIKVAANVITVSGINKQLVGETSAQIRSIKKPEPYKGKGIKYAGEQIRRKAGKAAKAVGD
ncbi:MAG: 50S ribosomal protein L6 [bacterium]